MTLLARGIDIPTGLEQFVGVPGFDGVQCR